MNSGDVLSVKVKPNSSKSSIEYKDGQMIAYLKSQPVDNKANEELIKLFKKEMNLKVEIKSGHTSKNKLVRVI